MTDLRTTEALPKRLADDLRYAKVTVRYRTGCGNEELTVVLENAHLQFIPLIAGWDRGRLVRIPLVQAQQVDIDGTNELRRATFGFSEEVEREPFAVARYHRMKWDELVRFVPDV